MTPALPVVLCEGSTTIVQVESLDWCRGNKSQPEATATVSEARGSGWGSPRGHPVPQPRVGQLTLSPAHTSSLPANKRTPGEGTRRLRGGRAGENPGQSLALPGVGVWQGALSKGRCHPPRWQRVVLWHLC